MEKFFTPVEQHQGTVSGVHGKGELAQTGQPHVHHQHHPHHHHSRYHHHHHHQDTQEARGGSHADQGVRHHHHSLHGEDHHHEHPHHSHHEHHHHHSHKGHCQADVTSYTSSTSSSSFSSSPWSSEASIANESFLVDSRRKYSQSCMDISKGRRAFEEDEDEEDTRPLLTDDRHLYKSASLERSLASGDNLEIPESRMPKKAVSAIQLPTKRVLKNKQVQRGGGGTDGNVRKAKSMEALSSQGEKNGVSSLRGGDGLPNNQRTLERRKEEARGNMIKEKLQFSAFLNEITRQVISPSRLNSLGVANAQRPAKAGSISPKLAGEEYRGQGCREEEGAQRQQSNRPSSPDSVTSSAHSLCSWYSSSSQHQHFHCSSPGSPQLQCHSSGSLTDVHTSPENSSSLEQGQGQRGGKQCHSRSSNLQTDITATSPELSPSVIRHRSHPSHSYGHHHHDYSVQHSLSSQPQHPKQAHHAPSQRDASPGMPLPPQQESHLQRNIASPEPKKTGHMVKEDVMSEVNRVQILQKQNEDLHHSLQQTTMRIECMEVEFKTNHQQLVVDLQSTQLELEKLKEQFKRLEGSFSSTQQTNQMLEKKLQSVVSSLSQEAQEKGFETKEAASQFPYPVAHPPSQFMDCNHQNIILGTTDSEVLRPVLEEVESDWHVSGGGTPQGVPKGPGEDHWSVTAFLALKQELGQCAVLNCDQKGDVDVENESRRDERVKQLHIPHLQFSMHPETLPVPTADLSFARFRSTPNSVAGYGTMALPESGSPIRVLSASLEELCTTGVKQYQPDPAPPKCAEAVISLHHPEGGALGYSHEGSMLCNRRQRNNEENSGGPGRVGGHFQPGERLLYHQTAPTMISHLVCQLQPAEMKTHGWTNDVTEEVLNGERTQL